MSKPTISLTVVMNGPDAMAGSSFNLLIMSGIVEPMTAEMPNVQRIEIPTIMANIQFPYNNVINDVISSIQIKPIIKPVLNSLRIIFQKLPFSIVPSASPRTATANDCVPIFPAEPIIIGIKTASTTTDSNVSSNCPITPLVIIPANMRKTIQGARFFVF